MWIRLQDKEMLLDVGAIIITLLENEQAIVYVETRRGIYNVARYSSKERAIEEIGHIDEMFRKSYSNYFVYQMRGENEK